MIAIRRIILGMCIAGCLASVWLWSGIRRPPTVFINNESILGFRYMVLLIPGRGLATLSTVSGADVRQPNVDTRPLDWFFKKKVPLCGNFPIRAPKGAADFLSGPILLRYATWPDYYQLSIGFPLWLPPILFAIYPAFAAIGYHARRRASRRRLGLCVSCAYDLTGNISGICPECGTAINPP